MENGKIKVLGIAPYEAMKMLMHYDWPQNYTQFKRLTRELAVLTVTSYIINSSYGSLSDTSMDLERPLEEITRDIIKKAVANNHGNQILTAKHLQISRTTLWRYLRV